MHLLQEGQQLTAAQTADVLSTRCHSTAFSPIAVAGSGTCVFHNAVSFQGHVAFAIDKWISAAQWWHDTDRGN